MENKEISVMEAATRLGKLISESRERKNAVAAADTLRNNAAASEMMAKYNELRQSEMLKLQQKEPTKEELENFQKLMQDEFNRLAENEVIKAYIEANGKYEGLVKRVNSVLAYYINGEENEEGGCGGNCASCGGCH